MSTPKDAPYKMVQRRARNFLAPVPALRENGTPITFSSNRKMRRALVKRMGKS